MERITLGTKCCTRNGQLRIHRAFSVVFPTIFHMSAVLSKGLSLSQRIFTGNVQWTFSGTFQWNSTFVTSGVYIIFCPETCFVIVFVIFVVLCIFNSLPRDLDLCLGHEELEELAAVAPAVARTCSPRYGI